MAVLCRESFFSRERGDKKGAPVKDAPVGVGGVARSFEDFILHEVHFEALHAR
jgi:hypothetical protein